MNVLPFAQSSRGKTTIIEGFAKTIITMQELNERYALLEAPGAASAYVSRADFQPITDLDLKRRLPDYVVAGCKTDGDGATVYKSAYAAWTGNPDKHRYTSIAFTSKAVSNNVFNLHKGLGVTPKPGKCDLILNHIEEVICSGDKAEAENMVNLLAWQIQNIGQPSRIAVVLKSKDQQAGKGILLENVMAKIYGPSGFIPATMDQIIGRFNDGLRGCAFVFLDEVLFCGDRKAADAIKGLVTRTEMGIETKGLPIIKHPVAVNLWLATNHDNAAHIEESDQRYWVLNVAAHRVGDYAYFAALDKEINESGGREAFAHHLLNLDVSKFTPWRDIKKDNAAKRDMIREAINPYDARKWLEACCHSEEVIGLKNPDGGGWMPWVEGERHSFGTLSAAYSEWQKTVKSRVGADPTKSGGLGELLGKAGIEDAPRTRKGNMKRSRVLPSTEVCHAKLMKGA